MSTGKHQNNFDLIRIVAALAVVFSHFLRLFDIGEDPILEMTGHSDFSELGVIVFFVISGYLVSKSLLFADSRNHFITNRCLRIFPGFLVCLLFCVFVAGTIATTWDLGEYLTSRKTYLFFLNSYLFTFQYQLPGVFENNPRQFTVNSAIWTLCLEFTAYLILYFIYSKFKQVKITRIIYVTLIVIALYIIFADSNILFAKQIEDPLGPYFLFYYNATGALYFILYFFMGACLSLVDPKWLKMKWLFALLICAWVLSWRSNYYELIEYITLPYCIIYLGLAHFEPTSRIVRKTGDLSYGIYLYHSPIAQTVWAKLHHTLNTESMVIISLIILGILSWLSWVFVEKFALSFKRYSYRSRKIISKEEINPKDIQA